MYQETAELRERLEIKAKADKHRQEIRRLRGEIEVEQARLRVVHAECSHPALFKTSCMGESGTHCPDCGYGT